MSGLLRRKRIYSDRRYLYLGYGEDLISKEEGRIFADMGEGEGKHLIMFAASGSGKTEFLARKTYEEIHLGLQVFCIDPKGSKSWINAFLQACKETETLKDAVILALPYPEVSVKFNPLQGLTPHQIADVVSSGIPPSKEAFWKDISYEITLAVALGLYARGKKNITLSDIYNYVRVEKLQELMDKVLADVKNFSDYRDEAINALDKIATYDPQFFPRVNSSLRTYLTRLITGIPGKILNVNVKRNVIEERLEEGRLKFYAFLNSEAMKQVAYDVARLLFAWLLTYIGKKSAKLEKIPQLRLNVDEVTEIGFHEINKAIRLVRERNVSVCLVTQSPYGLMSSFREKGKEIVSDIINSCNTRIFMKLNSPEDASYAVSFAPQVNKPRAIIHKNHISITYTRAPAIEPFVFQSLDVGCGVAFTDGSAYLFYTPVLKIPSLEIVWKEGVKTQGKETIDLRELAKNYEVEEEVRFTDSEVKEFYEEFKDFVQIFKNDFEKCLKFIDLAKSKQSVVKGSNLLKEISLLEHSLRVARKAYELVKDAQMSQEEKEIIFLASLSHDFGKAIAEPSKYTTEDHTRLTKQVLENLGVSKRIIELAVSHHEKSKDPLLEFVKKADHLARKEEEKKVLKEKEVSIDLNKLRQILEKEVNLRDDYAVVSDAKHVYVEKNYVHKLFEKLTGKTFADEEIEKITSGTFTEVAITVRNKLVRQGVYLQIPNWNPAEFTNRKRMNKHLFAGFRINQVS